MDVTAEQRAMADDELSKLFTDDEARNLRGEDLCNFFTENCNKYDLQTCSTSARARVRDYLHSHDVAVGKGSGQPIVDCLFNLFPPPTAITAARLRSQAGTSASADPRTQSDTWVPPPDTSTSYAARDIVKTPRLRTEQYVGPHEPPLLATVEEAFFADCDALNVPENVRLNVMYRFLRGDALKHFRRTILPVASSATAAFLMLAQHYNTHADQRNNKDEWNALSFEFLTIHNRDKSSAEVLQMLYNRAQDLQTLLGPPYISDRLLCDFLIRATANTPFARHLRDEDAEIEPHALYTQLLNAMNRERRESTRPNASSTPSTDPSGARLSSLPNTPSHFFVDEPGEYEILYTHSGSPSIRRRSMRNPLRDFRSRGRTRGRGAFVNTRSCGSYGHSVPQFNKKDHTGNYMLCNLCNSWFHLIAECPYRTKATSIMFEEEHVHLPVDSANTVDSRDENIQVEIDEPIDEHATTFFAQIVEQKSNHAFIGDFPIFFPPDLVDSHYAAYQERANLATTFNGICIDEGATESICGKPQYEAYLRTVHIPSNLRTVQPSRMRLRFGGKGDNQLVLPSLGIVPIRFPVEGYGYFEYMSHIVNNDVPMLLGLDLQRRLKATTVKNDEGPEYIEFPNLFRLPLTFKKGHLFYEFPVNEVLFSDSELYKLHRNLGHPTAENTFRALERAYPLEAKVEDKRKLEHLVNNCFACEKYKRMPQRYRASAPDEMIFNQDVAIDIMFIDKTAILHAVCKHTHLSRAAVLLRQDGRTIWETFMRIWVCPYLGAPMNIWVDQAKQFIFGIFVILSNALGSNIVPVAVEAHWSLVVERYHEPLSRVVRKLRVDCPDLPLDILVDYANLAMSHTMGPEGFTPAVLAFGAEPRLPIADVTQVPISVAQRMEVAAIARREYESVVAKMRAQKAMSTPAPSERFLSINPGDRVLAFRENKGWTGPYKLLSNAGKLSLVVDLSNKQHTFHVTQLKPYPSLPLLHEMTKEVQSLIVKVCNKKDDPRFAESQQKEYNGILAKGGLRPLLRSKIPPGANFVGNRFVNVIKDFGSEFERLKSRWILLGYSDREKDFIVNEAPVLMRFSLRILFFLSVSYFDNVLWTRDAEQAYFQSKPLPREVYTDPPKELKLDPIQYALQIILPQYGLAESSTCWRHQYEPVYTKDLQMCSAHIDPCLYYKKENSKLIGVTGLVTDDTANTGTNAFAVKEAEATSRFITNKHDILKGKEFRFFGQQVTMTTEGLIVRQHAHIKELSVIDTSIIPIQQKEFRSQRGKLLYRSQTSQPQSSYGSARLSQVKLDQAQKDDVIALNKLIRHLQLNPEQGLSFPKLDMSSVCLRVYTDAGHKTNADLTSQLGVFVIIVDKNLKCNILHWSSNKCARHTKSMISAETYAFADGYDIGLSFKMLLEDMLSIELKLFMFTDCKSLFDTITKYRRTKELQLMYEIAAIRRAYQSTEIANIAWIRTEFSIADSLTRHANNKILQQVLSTGYIQHPIEEWISKS